MPAFLSRLWRPRRAAAELASAAIVAVAATVATAAFETFEDSENAAAADDGDAAAELLLALSSDAATCIHNCARHVPCDNNEPGDKNDDAGVEFMAFSWMPWSCP